MTAGRGWIALALVVFASWRPVPRSCRRLSLWRRLHLQLHAQALGIGIPSQFLSSLPYLATISFWSLISQNAPVDADQYPGLARQELRAGDR